MKNRKTSLILCVFGGLFGIHKFYEEEYMHGVIYFCTVGMFFVWWIRDIFVYALMKEDEYDPKEVSKKKKEEKRIKKETTIRKREEIKTKHQEILRNKACPRCGGKNYHAFVFEKEISPEKKIIRHGLNLNPLHPLTFAKTKEKVVRKKSVKMVSQFVCDDCGKIFS